VVKVVDKVPNDRHGKVYIERIATRSDGGRDGHTIKGGYYVKYAKKVKKGKRVICYAVYNPANNRSDDVVCFVSCHKVKADKVINAVENSAKAETERVHCKLCDGTGVQGDGVKCPYVYYDDGVEKHMTLEEIKDFEWSESHYMNENGEWVER
jgi:hypothetical protein